MGFENVVALVGAAVGGGLFTEIVRRVIPSQDKSMELQVQRETESTRTQIDLTKHLWDEIERLNKRVVDLDTKLTQAQETIVALTSNNRLLQTDIDILSKRMGCQNFKTSEEPHIILPNEIKDNG